MAEPQRIQAEFSEDLEFLFQPERYKILYGGRGSGKSWGIARALLVMGAEKPIRVLCAREYQNSIAESVHQLLSDQISMLGMDDFYDIQKTKILGRNGTDFSYSGLRVNISSLKSFEGADIAWIEEGQTATKRSWEILIPTIRKEGSEIWVSFNPELDSDETYVRFVKNPPTNSVVKKINWSDNPWLSKELYMEMLDLKSRDHDAWLTVWEGHCRQAMDGAVYANEMRAATEEGRIMKVPYDRSKPVFTFWDLGRADQTSIWFAQRVGFDIRVIDFHQSNGKDISKFIKIIQDKPYVYDTDWLPHDAENEVIQHPLSVAGQMTAAGRKVRIVPKLRVHEGINAARTIFPQCYFDAEKCEEGLQALRRYRYEIIQHKGSQDQSLKSEPLHDYWSHAADAWRYLAVAFQEQKPKIDRVYVPTRGTARAAGTSWMGR